MLFDISTTKESFFCFAGELYCLYEEFANMPRISVCVFSCLVMLVPNYAGGLLFLVIRMGCVILQDRVSNFYQGGKLLLSCFIYLSERRFYGCACVKECWNEYSGRISVNCFYVICMVAYP